MRHLPAQAEQLRARAVIDKVAADWIARHARGLTKIEETEFATWLRLNARHANAFAGLEQTWRSLDRLPEVRLPDGRALDAGIPDKAARPPVLRLLAGSRTRRRIVFSSIVLAAAASVAIAFIMRTSMRPAAPGLVRSAATATGDFDEMNLPDGSIVRLNTDTEVKMVFTNEERRVVLRRGEAGFTAAKDAARPFIVRAGWINVRAVGTMFNVRLRPEAVEVLVTEGQVRVDDSESGESVLPGNAAPSPATPPAVLLAGQKAVVGFPAAASVAPPATVASLAADEIARKLAWQERRLEFVSTPLTEIVIEFNRYNSHKLVIVDPRLNERRFGGTFQADNADAFVRLLETRFGIEADRVNNETRLRLADH